VSGLIVGLSGLEFFFDAADESFYGIGLGNQLFLDLGRWCGL
jgi:hypothetical protein